MTHGTSSTLRIILIAAVTALAVAAPTASAKPVAGGDVRVCNQATHTSVGGDYVATDGDTGSAARYQEGLKAHPGKGAGLMNAAAHSRALSQCSIPGGPNGPDNPPSDS